MFQGYTQETVDFLWGIRFNNERGWFMEHKQIYQTALLEPTRALGGQIYDGLHAMLPDEPLQLKVSRIYRDARRLFGRGPYKDNLWLSVRTGEDDWTGRPTFYFEIAPDYYGYGMSFWSAAPALMELYRRQIDRAPGELEKLVRRFNRQDVFTLTGPDYARSKGEVSDLLRPWYQKKSLSLQHELPLDEKIFSPALADEIVENFHLLLPFYHYFSRLCAAALQRRAETDRAHTPDGAGYIGRTKKMNKHRKTKKKEKNDMNIWHDIAPSRVKPEDFWAVIEIEKGSKNKYELDKETGMLRLDRILYTSTHYPANYGFIPRTWAEDGDPLDVLVLCSESIRPLSLVRCFPIGVISMEDGGSQDEKIIAIPFEDPTYHLYTDISELPAHVASEIRHFFRVYKSLEGKETDVSDVLGREEAVKVIVHSQNAYIEKYCK